MRTRQAVTGPQAVRSPSLPGRLPAFALIELLVVIPIIAILAAMLLPTLAGAKVPNATVPWYIAPSAGSEFFRVKF